MYFSSKIHILSTTLMKIAAANTMLKLLGGGIRFFLRRHIVFSPDMTNGLFNYSSRILTVIQLLAAIYFFYQSWLKLKKYRSLVDEDDYEEMGRLQREVLKDNKSSLNANAIHQLLNIWAVILIGVEIVYDLTSFGYTRFIDQLYILLNNGDPTSMQLFNSMYNNTHGFKYIGMLIAIILGCVITGVFLQDRYLMVASGVSTLIFLIAFFMIQMQTVTILDRVMGVVWTSVIFHAMQTVGLFCFALYLRHRYRGL